MGGAGGGGGGGGKESLIHNCWRTACAHLPQLSGVPDIFRARPYYDDIRVTVVMTHCVYILLLCTCTVYARHNNVRLLKSTWLINIYII